MNTEKQPIYPVEVWDITEQEFQKGNNYRNETTFALSNGYIGTRGTFEEAYPFDIDTGLEGNFVNGFYESEHIRYGEANFGSPLLSQSLLNLPNLKETRVLLDGELFSMKEGSVEEYKRTLHMKEGVLERTFVWMSPKGKKTKIRISRLVSFARKNIMVMEEMYQLGMEKRKEELKALQAMMNPHFLYNCLSSIKWKAIRSEQDEIADITGLLAKFYRTALNNGKQITIVQNELENVKAYLQIQLKSHENSFEVIYNLSEEGRECRMPNFLLQPIVENAICHGVDFCEGEKGKIRIEYLCEEDFLVFHVYNNGGKLSEEEVEKILSTPGKGYGIYNIRERIRMYYDEECGLFSHVTEEGLVCFTIKIRKTIKEGETL